VGYVFVSFQMTYRINVNTVFILPYVSLCYIQLYYAELLDN